MAKVVKVAVAVTVVVGIVAVAVGVVGATVAVVVFRCKLLLFPKSDDC